MSALFNPWRLVTTYEAGEEVLNSYFWFGELVDEGDAPDFSDPALTNINAWFDDLYDEWSAFLAIEFRTRGWYADVPDVDTATKPPQRRVVIKNGGAGVAMLPNDTYYNVVTSGATPSFTTTRGGQRLSGVPRTFGNGGRVSATVTANFNAAIGPLYLAPIEIEGRTFRMGLNGTYNPEPLTPTPYFSSVDTIFLNPVLGSRKDRIPNRRNFPRGTSKENMGP